MDTIKATFTFPKQETITARLNVQAVVPAEHPLLTKRGEPNQHPIEAITGLSDALAQSAGDIAQERQERIAEDERIARELQNETSTRERQGNVLKQSIATERQERQAAIQSEEYDRKLQDTAILQELSREEAKRQQEDNALQSNIDTEKRERVAADNTLTASINALKTSKQDALTAAQVRAVNSGITAAKVSTYDGYNAKIATNTTAIQTINSKIPSSATASNQLADKDFVNSSINAVAAYYITSDTQGDAFETKAELIAGPWYFNGTRRTPTTNDYAIVVADETKDGKSTRYTYTGSQWAFQYTINDTPFTQAQVDALNSGINSELVDKFNGYETSKQDTLKAGSYVEIAADNTVNVTIKGGTGISIDTDGTINNTLQWGSIAGDISTQTDLQTALNGKQGTLSTAQLNATNSGITSAKVETYDGYDQRIVDNNSEISALTIEVSDIQTQIGDIETALYTINSGA